jgi:hypothetical protein
MVASVTSCEVGKHTNRYATTCNIWRGLQIFSLCELCELMQSASVSIKFLIGHSITSKIGSMHILKYGLPTSEQG